MRGLFADDGPGPAGWGAIYTGVITVVGGAVVWVVRMMDRRRANKKEDRADAIVEQGKIIERLTADLTKNEAKFAALEAKITELVAHHQNCLIEVERRKADHQLSMARCDYLEGILHARGINFVPWADRSGPHKPLPSGTHKPVPAPPPEADL